MKLAIISDFHLGFNDFKREQEAFEQALTGLKQCLEESEVILIAGDLFHKANPGNEVILKAIEIFNEITKTKGKEKKIRIEKKNKKVKEFKTKKPVVVAIHGTHEFKGNEFKNAVQVLEAANCLIYLHGEKTIIENNGEKINVIGFGGIPEKYAKNALNLLKPEKLIEKNAFNILIIHQSIKEFIDFGDEMIATLSLSDLPKEFDLIVNGHIHSNYLKRLENKRIFLMPGSTIITQKKKIESEKKKGFYVIDSKTKEINFKEIKGQKEFYYKEVKIDKDEIKKTKEKIREIIKETIKGKNNPIIVVKVNGITQKGFNAKDYDFKDIKEEFKEKAILTINNKLKDEKLKEKIKELRAFQEKRLNVRELGMKLIEKNLIKAKKTDFNYEKMFELLKKGEIEKVIELLKKEKTN